MAMENLLAYIIEDDLDTARLYQFILELVGYRTEIIADGETAMTRLIENRPDLILLDLMLPASISGLDILQTVREDPNFAATRVIVISGHHQMAQNLELEPDLTLLKPISISQLSKLVVRMHPAKDELLHDAAHDTLTVLYNQPFFVNRLELAIARTERRPDFRFAVMVLEMEGMKRIALNRGEEYADRVLVAMSHCLNAILRQTDTLARVGDYQFAILLEELNPEEEDLNKLAERIQASLYEKLKTNELTIGLFFHFGMVTVTAGLATPEEYIAAAQQDLAANKPA